jgi:hypothetical protein
VANATAKRTNVTTGNLNMGQDDTNWHSGFPAGKQLASMGFQHA